MELTATVPRRAAIRDTEVRAVRHAIMNTLGKHLIGMDLGQQQRVQMCERGYAMAALLVSLAVMSVMMSMALPVWSQAARRGREAELVFRGEQYARAVELYQRQFAGAFPPDFETLVEQRFLRRLYKDPMTEDGVFQPIYQVQAAAAQGAPATAARPGETTGGGGPAGVTTSVGLRGSFGELVQGPGGGAQGGVVGVVSKSTDASIMLYNGRSKYNEWAFIHMPSAIQPGAAPGGGVGGAPAGQPNQPSRLQFQRPGKIGQRGPDSGTQTRWPGDRDIDQGP
jgi:type II secretory pathway pseudopilin PulG